MNSIEMISLIHCFLDVLHVLDAWPWFLAYFLDFEEGHSTRLNNVDSIPLF